VTCRASLPFTSMEPRRGLAFLVVPLLAIVLAACGGVQTAACSLFDYGLEIQAELNDLLALDAALVAQAGTPENSAALEAIDSLDATRTEAQGALDSAADDVGPVIQRAFQAALDATEIGATNLRTAVESGDPATVTDAMGDVQTAVNAIDTFMTALGDSRLECGEAASPSTTGESSASAVASASASASASAPASETPAPTRTPEQTPSPTPSSTPTPAPTPTPSPTPSPTPEPTPTPSPSPSPTPTPEPTPTASATPSASPSPTPSASLTASPSPTGTASQTAAPSPSASGESGDQGPGPVPWLLGLVLVAVAGGAIYVWYRNRDEDADAVDVTDDGLPPEDQPPGGAPPPPSQPPPPSRG
jgi:outer membrane biosynthesis protein TonB